MYQPFQYRASPLTSQEHGRLVLRRRYTFPSGTHGPVTYLRFDTASLLLRKCYYWHRFSHSVLLGPTDGLLGSRCAL